MSDKPEIKIGDEYFIYDINKRVYESRNSAPTFRGHFWPVRIIGETSRSWILSRYDQKVPKADPWSILYTSEMIDDGEWKDRNGYKISERARSATIEQLRQIAEILGYKP